MRFSRQSAFSLIEVVIALGIAAFALIAILASLPIGLMLNRDSSDELHASNLLTMLAADLRNTDPRLNNGKSLVFGLQIPYQISGTQVAFNGTIMPVTVASTAISSSCTSGVDSLDNPITLADAPPAYQVSVIYTTLPSGNPTVTPIQARLVVSWPGLKSAKVSDLTDLSKVKGFVETYIAFPAP
jgi:uncharacterized protein (TIGR02598 family)